MKQIVVFFALFLGLSLTPLAQADDRSKNTGDDFGAWPKSENRSVESALIRVSTNDDAFSDKKILKASVFDNWGPPTRNPDDGIVYQQLVAYVAVHDPQNKKCWVWKAWYNKYPPAKDIMLIDTESTGSTIDCAKVGGPKSASAKPATKKKGK